MNSLSDAYRDIYNELVRSNAKRFILVQPKDGCGWGNQLRALTLGLIFAVCSRRILVVDNFLIEEHFLPPAGIDWTFRRWRGILDGISQKRKMNLRLRPEDFDQNAWEKYETQLVIPQPPSARSRG